MVFAMLRLQRLEWSVATNKAKANAHGKKLTSCEPTPSMFDTEGMGSKVFLVESIQHVFLAGTV